MPYVSKAQQGLFHSPNSPVSKDVVADFDKASKGQKGLPYHVGDKAAPKPKGAKQLFAKKKQFQEG